MSVDAGPKARSVQVGHAKGYPRRSFRGTKSALAALTWIAPITE